MTDLMTMTRETPALSEQGTSLARQVEVMLVVDDATFTSAGEMLRAIKGYTKRVHDVLDPIVESAHKAHKVAVDQRKGLLQHAEAAETVLKGRMADYEQVIERRRLEAEAAARREQERLEAEARRVADEENARARAEAQDRILEDALAAEASGDVAAVDFLLEEPAYVPTVAPLPVFVPPIQVATPRANGVSFSSTWSAELISLPDLVKAAAAGNAVALSCLTFDQVRANGLARSLKANLKVPGVKAVEKRTATVRGA